MLHRAILGSLERFIALYIEMKAGDFPFWLAPVQVQIAPITERQIEYAKGVRDKLASAGVRVHLDDRNEKLGMKIRDAELAKVPLMLVIGEQEQQGGTAMPRWRHGASGKASATPIDELVAKLARDTHERRTPSQS
jgi:threonyl-tRNA synthetase